MPALSLRLGGQAFNIERARDKQYVSPVEPINSSYGGHRICHAPPY